MIIITPIIIAIIAFSLGPPGALIHREIFGLKNAAIPINETTIPTIISIVFVILMVSISV